MLLAEKQRGDENIMKLLAASLPFASHAHTEHDTMFKYYSAKCSDTDLPTFKRKKKNKPEPKLF